MQRRFDRIVRTGIVSLAIIPVLALACTCADPGEISEDKVIDAMCVVDAVFIGKAAELMSTVDQTRVLKIYPVEIFKGDVADAVIAKTFTTCDHWFNPNRTYLVFGNIESVSNELSTSICGATRFTSDLASAQFQMSVIEKNDLTLDELCGAAASGARRIRIIQQDRDDTKKLELESLRLLKEGLKQSRIDYEQTLDDTRTIQENEE